MGANGADTQGIGGEDPVAGLIEQALQSAETALEQVTRISVAQIRKGIEGNCHIEAAERDLRNGLRQLVLAQRDWQAPSRTRRDEDLGAPGALSPRALDAAAS